ncbi:hypothetical protein GCM10010428_21160 [Actinosynnema pretiosum subsp. pretiosum]
MAVVTAGHCARAGWSGVRGLRAGVGDLGGWRGGELRERGGLGVGRGEELVAGRGLTDRVGRVARNATGLGGAGRAWWRWAGAAALDEREPAGRAGGG